MSEGCTDEGRRAGVLGKLQAADRSFVDVLDVFTQSPKTVPDQTQCLALKLKQEELGEDDKCVEEEKEKSREEDDKDEEEDEGKGDGEELVEDDEPPEATSSPIPVKTEAEQCVGSPPDVALSLCGHRAWYQTAQRPRSDPSPTPGTVPTPAGGGGSDTLSGPPSCESTNSRPGSASGMSPDTTGEPCPRPPPQPLPLLQPEGNLHFPGACISPEATKRPHQLKTEADTLDFPRDVPKKKGRRQYTDKQVALLEQAFHLNHYPTREDRVRLQAISAVPIEAIKIWFQNRRSRERRRCKAQGMPIPQRTPLPQNTTPTKWVPSTILPEVPPQKPSSGLTGQPEVKMPSSNVINLEDRRGPFPLPVMGWPASMGRPSFPDNKVAYHGNPVIPQLGPGHGKIPSGGYTGHGIVSSSSNIKVERASSMEHVAKDFGRSGNVEVQSSIPVPRHPRITSTGMDLGAASSQRQGLGVPKSGPGLEARGFPRASLGVPGGYRPVEPTLYGPGYGTSLAGVCGSQPFYGGFPQPGMYPQQLASYYNQTSAHFPQYGSTSPGRGNFAGYPYNYCPTGSVISTRQGPSPTPPYTSYVAHDPYNTNTSASSYSQSAPFSSLPPCCSAYLGPSGTCLNPSRPEVPETSLTWSSQYPTTSPCGPARTRSSSISSIDFQPTLPMQRVRQALQDRLSRVERSEAHSTETSTDFMQFRLGGSTSFPPPILNMEPPAPHRTVLPPTDETPSPSGLDTPPSASPISSEHASTHNSPWAVEYSGFYSALVAHGDSETDTDRTHDESNIHQVSDE